MANDSTQTFILQYLARLNKRFQSLDAERTFLLSGVQARLAAVNTERQEIIAEAQLQLTRLNEFRAADGLPALTLAQVREMTGDRPIN